MFSRRARLARYRQRLSSGNLAVSFVIGALGLACENERPLAPLRDPLPGDAPSAGVQPAEDAGAASGNGGGGESPPLASGGAENTTPDLDLDPSKPSEPAAAGADAGLPTGLDPAAPLEPVKLVLAGDSIVQTYADTPSDTDQAGWGQMLGGFFGPLLTVDNRAIGGRTARRFIDEGRLDDLMDALEPGDYLLVEFGTNDGNRTATYDLNGQTIPYFLDPATDFKSYLQRYIDAADSRQAHAVLVTPTPRSSAYCTGGNGTGAHAAAMRELGAATGTPVVDLNAAAVEALRAICPAPTPENFFLLRPDGTVDGTHFQERGARQLASMVATLLTENVPALAPYGRDE